MSLYGSAVNGGEAAYYKVQNENLELKGETNSSLNIGLETRLFNRVNLSFDTITSIRRLAVQVYPTTICRCH